MKCATLGAQLGLPKKVVASSFPGLVSDRVSGEVTEEK